jgi:hypothetical protein
MAELSFEQRQAKQAEVIRAYNRLFSTTDGKLVLEDLKQAHWINRPTFDVNTNLMSMREGERNVVLRIMALVEDGRTL